MADNRDLPRIERNVRKMIDLGAPTPDVDAYLNEEGMTPESFRSAMMERKKPEDARGAFERSGRALALGTRNVVEGLAAPLLVINDAIGAPVGLGGGRDAFASILDKVFPKAETPTEKFVGRVAQEGASVLTPMGLARTAAPFLGATGQAVTTALQSAPATQMAAGVGAGVGGGTARALAPDSDALDVGLSLGGGLLAGALPTAAQVAAGGVSGALQPLSRAGQEKIVGQTLRSASGNPETLVNQLDNAAQPILEGSFPTTAEAVRSPGLSVLERGVRQSSPQAADAFAMREAQRNAVRSGTVDSIGGPATVGPADVAATAGRLRDTVVQDQNNAASELGAAARRELGALGDGRAPEVAGAVIRDELGQALDRAKQSVSSAYKAIDPEGTASIQSYPIKTATADAVKKYFGEGSGGPPGSVETLANTVKQLGSDSRGMIPWEVAQAVRHQANAVLSSSAAREDARIMSFARQVKDAVDGAAAAAASKGGSFTPEQAAAWKAANEARRDMGERFQEGAPKKVIKTTGYGEAAIPDGAVGRAFFNPGPGGFEDAAKFLSAVGDRPKAVEAMKDHIVFDLRRFATGSDGQTINPQKLFNWMTKHRGALENFPELRAQIESAGKAQKIVDSVAAGQAERLADIEKSAAGYFLRQDPEAAIASVLNSKSAAKDMADLVKRVNYDDRAMAGLRRGVIDNLMSRAELTSVDAAGRPVVSVDKFARWIAQNEKTLAPLFKPEQVAALRTIAEDMRSQNYPLTVARTPGSPTYQNLTTANLIAKVTLGTVDPTSPVLSGTFGRALGWLYKVPEQQVQQLLVDAMLDPTLARKLAAKATPTNIEGAADLLRKRAVAIGLGATPELEVPQAQPMPLALPQGQRVPAYR